MLIRSKQKVRQLGVLSSRDAEIDDIRRQQHEVHLLENRQPRAKRSVPANEMSFLLQQRKGRRVNFEKHESAPNPDYVPVRNPHFVALQRGFLKISSDGTYQTTGNPRWASTFETFDEADAAAQKACKALFDVRGQFYAIFVKP